MGDRLPGSEGYDDSCLRHGERRSLYRPSNQIAQMYELMEIHRLNHFVSPNDSFDFGTNAPTVMLVPGFGCRRGIMFHLGEDLKKTMNVAYAGNFPNLNTCSIREAATMLVPVIRKILEQQKNGDVTLIGHSNGWLISLLALMHAKDRIRRVISMGTPYGWAPRAEKNAHLFSSCGEVNEVGGFLGEMDFTDRIEEGILAMIASDDQMVPPDNQTPHSLGGVINTYTLEDAGHFGFLIGDRVKETACLIRRVLHQAKPHEILHTA